MVANMTANAEKTYVSSENVRRINPERVSSMLRFGTIESCREAMNDYFREINFREIHSFMLRLYIAMDIYVQANEFAQSIGISDPEFTDRFGSIDNIDQMLLTPDKAADSLIEIMTQCIEWRKGFTHGSRSSSMDRALKYIDETYSQDDLSLKSVADAMNFTPAYFSALFKKEMGINFSDYLTKVRMEKAKALLSSTAKMIYEVAGEVGFKDYRYFGQIFNKYTGQTPREFQSSCKKAYISELERSIPKNTI